MRHVDLMAREAHVKANPRHCALCGCDIPRDRYFKTPYCSFTCSMTVWDARASVGRLVQAAIKRGEMRPARELTCVDCGKSAFDYDHRRYLRPLDVVPTCRACNLKRGPALDVAELVSKYLNSDLPIAELMLIKRSEREAEQERVHRAFIHAQLAARSDPGSPLSRLEPARGVA